MAKNASKSYVYKRKLKLQKQNNDYSELIEKKRNAFLAEAFPTEEDLRIQEEIFRCQVKEQEITQRDCFEQNDFFQWMEKYFLDNKIEERYFKHEYFYKFFEERKMPIPEVFIVSGQKTGGKTYSMCEQATKILKDPFSQIVWLRNTKQEIDQGFTAQVEGAEYPFTYKKTGSQLIRKPGRLPERNEIDGVEIYKDATHATQAEKRKLFEEASKNKQKVSRKRKDLDFRHYDPEHCGYVMWVNGNGLAQFQGGSYPKVKAIFWDECNDLGDITPSDVEKVHRNILSWSRNKKRMKLFIALNNLRHTDGSVGNIVLENFGIPYGAAWKRYQHDENLWVFFVDLGKFGDLFKGPKDQAHFGLLGGLRGMDDLITNEPVMFSNKVLSRGAFLSGIPEFAFFCSFREKYYAVFASSHHCKNTGITDIIIYLEEYTTEYKNPYYDVWTDDEVMANVFGSLVLMKPKKLGNIAKNLCKMQKRRCVFFANDSVRKIFCDEVMPYIKTRYSIDIEKVIKPRTK